MHELRQDRLGTDKVEQAMLRDEWNRKCDRTTDGWRPGEGCCRAAQDALPFKRGGTKRSGKTAPGIGVSVSLAPCEELHARNRQAGKRACTHETALI
jgi:hypothetical protein